LGGERREEITTLIPAGIAPRWEKHDVENVYQRGTLCPSNEGPAEPLRKCNREREARWELEGAGTRERGEKS